MRSFLGWTESAGGGSLFADGWVPEVAGCCAFARLRPTHKDEKHRRAQHERTITSEKTTASFCGHAFIVREEHDRRMSTELHFVHVRNRPEKLRTGWLIPRADPAKMGCSYDVSWNKSICKTEIGPGL